MRSIADLFAMIVAVSLLFTGLIHAAQPYYYVHAIANYRILSAEASGLVGLYLPYLQLVLAFCICFRIAEKASLATAAMVFLVFAVAQATVLARGINVDCGCFGFVAHPVSPTSLAVPVLLCCAATIAALARQQPHLGHGLSGGELPSGRSPIEAAS